MQRARPELLDMIYHREVLLWVERMEAQGWTLTERPSPPRPTPCVDPSEPPGSLWVIVTGRFYKHGPVAVFDGDQMAEFAHHRAVMGVEKYKSSAGVARWLESMSPEEAAAAVQAAKPRKERDDDFD